MRPSLHDKKKKHVLSTKKNKKILSETSSSPAKKALSASSPADDAELLQIYTMPVFDMMESYLVKELRFPPGLTLRLITRSAYVAFTMFIGMTFPFFGGLLSFFGGFAFAPTIYFVSAPHTYLTVHIVTNHLILPLILYLSDRSMIPASLHHVACYLQTQKV
ncbi:hypothetical protein ZIOFF_022524 [Zingiber officinale]|uniref:Amino acid transporter transmembrane domain-containing protein n=1 Tax=Zingiber officinale TaxID=94328 RepID=A0A8J5LHF7_ZINOF|nr:hypothetical protein ZIOFF_022524 [Zingiber officinale]